MESVGLLARASGWLYYDRAHERSRQVLDIHSAFFTADDVQHLDQVWVGNGSFGNDLNVNVTVGFGTDLVCKAMSAPWLDMFFSLALTAPNGSAVVGGEPCEVWQAGDRSPLTSLDVVACIGADGVPRLMNLTIGSQAGNVSQYYLFTNISVGPVDDSLFQPSDTCLKNYPTKPCDVGQGKDVIELDVYRIHAPEEPLGLANRNVGDGLGDMAFVCQEGFLDSGSDKYVSWWKFHVNTSFGPYANCVRGFCLGGSEREVGRESALGMGSGRLQGQCSDNKDVGSWFSLPEAGECLPGEAIGTRGCTWGPALRLRTVTASCIMQDRGLLKMCEAERYHAPFLRSRAIFLDAMWVEDPQEGGCPEVGEEVLVV